MRHIALAIGLTIGTLGPAPVEPERPARTSPRWRRSRGPVTDPRSGVEPAQPAGGP
ncbi:MULTISPECIES: hypothetical protein [Nonomuraea]|uniref:Uncharacterized protein n=1 Tax=Nonomuraea mangrovi TaxID=2316207 RepID=A0ABW4SQN6_9ACTN